MVAVGTAPPTGTTAPIISRWRPDAVSVLTFLLVLALVIPARFTFAPLGAVGRPDIMLGLVLLGWWLVTRVVPSLTVRHSQPLRWVVGLFLLTLFVSAALAYQRGLSPLEASGVERYLLAWLSTAGVILVVVDGIHDRSRLDVLLNRVILLGVFAASVAIAQFFVGFDLTQQIRIPGLSINGDLRAVELRSVVNRVYGTSLHPIEFGQLMAVVGAVSAHYAFHARDPNERRWRWIATAMLLGASLLSVSRSAVVSLAVLLVGFLFVWRPRVAFSGLFFAVIGMGMMRLAAPGLLGTIRALFENLGNDPSIQGRTNDYPAVFAYVEDSFVFGLGGGTFSAEEYFVLDNQWLAQLVTTGIVGTVGFAAIWLCGLAMAHHVSRTARDDETRHLGHTLMLTIFVFILTSFFFDSMAFSQIRIVSLILLGAAAVLWRLEGDADSRVLSSSGRRLMRSSRTVRGSEPGKVVALAPRPD